MCVLVRHNHVGLVDSSPNRKKSTLVLRLTANGPDADEDAGVYRTEWRNGVKGNHGGVKGTSTTTGASGAQVLKGCDGLRCHAFDGGNNVGVVNGTTAA